MNITYHFVRHGSDQDMDGCFMVQFSVTQPFSSNTLSNQRLACKCDSELHNDEFFRKKPEVQQHFFKKKDHNIIIK